MLHHVTHELSPAQLRQCISFYEALGWRSGSLPEIGVVFFQAGGMVLSLWDRDKLAEDSGVELGEGYGGVTLANAASLLIVRPPPQPTSRILS